MLFLDWAGHGVDGRITYEVFTQRGGRVGSILPRQTNGYPSSGIKARALPGYRVDNSKKVFATVGEAADYVAQRWSKKLAKTGRR